MIPITNAFKTALAKSSQTFCTILRVRLTNGTVLGFTDHDRDIIYDDGSGSVTYEAAFGYQRKDVAGNSDLSVDNTEYDGILNSPSITEADLHAGIWDYAAVKFSLINWADTTMGVLVLRKGWLGQVTIDRNTFTAELRGMMQAYARTIGELTSPTCRAQLYDARCNVDPSGQSTTIPPYNLTVTGTITGVSVDQMTLYDSARTEPGPTGGVAITAISNSNPGHVTLADGSTFFNLEAVTLSGITGPSLMPTLNQTVVITNLSGNVFDLGVNTTSYGAYSGGGMCTPQGGDSGFFDFGLMTFTSGLNMGLSGEVLSYVPGQWQLEIPFPYAIAPGDGYTMLAGCDKSLSTCKAKFSNVINMRAEPYLPGIDKIIQIGKQPSSG